MHPSCLARSMDFRGCLSIPSGNWEFGWDGLRRVGHLQLGFLTSKRAHCGAVSWLHVFSALDGACGNDQISTFSLLSQNLIFMKMDL